MVMAPNHKSTEIFYILKLFIPCLCISLIYKTSLMCKLQNTFISMVFHYYYYYMFR